MRPRTSTHDLVTIARLVALMLFGACVLPAQSDARAALHEHAHTMGVSGRVADEDGDALVGAELWLLPEGDVLAAAGFPTTLRSRDAGWGRRPVELLDDIELESFAHAVTDARGDFRVEGAAHAVAASDRLAWDPAPLPRDAQLVAYAPGRALAVIPLERREGRREHDLALRLPAEARVTGRVLDAQGAPLAHAEVRVADGRPQHPKVGYLGTRHTPTVTLPRWHRTHTDADGRFTLGALWRGEVSLRVQAPGHVPREVGPFVVAAGDTLAIDDVSLSPASILRGRVTDASGAPLAGVRVFAAREVPMHAGRIDVIEPFAPGDDRLPLELEVEHRRDTVRGVTADDGSFALEVAPDAALFVFARHPDFEPARIDRGAAPRTPVEFTLQPAARLTVRVVDELGQDAGDDVQLLARRLVAPEKQGGRLEVRRLADGRFEVPGIGPRGTQLIARRVGKFDATLLAAEGAAPGSEHEVTFKLPSSGRLAGTVTGRDELQLFRLSMELRRGPPGGPFEQAWHTTKRGGDVRRFAFTDLPAGRYELRVWGPADRRDASEVPPLVVELQPGEVRDDLVLDLELNAR